MSCPNAAGTITSSPPLDVSITDRSAAFPAAVPDVPLRCEYFMARHILCFHITNKFVLSLSHWHLQDSLNDVVQLRELALSQSNLDVLGNKTGFWLFFLFFCHDVRQTWNTRRLTCAEICKRTNTTPEKRGNTPRYHLRSERVKRTSF